MKKKTKARPNGKRKRSIGHRVREARLAQGMTQHTLAHAIGYRGRGAKSFICRVEADLQEPRLKLLERIAAALGVSLCELLP